MSGNNLRFICWLLLLVSTLAACNTSRSVTRRPGQTTSRPKPSRPNRAEPQPTDKTTKVDKGDNEGTTPTRDPEVRDPARVTNNSGNAVISLVIPFLSDRYSAGQSSLPENSAWAIGYYSGLRLGLERLEREGQHATVHVFDNQASEGRSANLLGDPELRASQAIIGPYLPKNVRATANAARPLALPIVVPYSAALNVANPNERLLQLNPGILNHFNELVGFLDRVYDPEEVILVGLPNGAQSRQIQYLQQRHTQRSPGASPYREWILSSADVGMQNLDWNDKFVEGKETVFVLPFFKDPKKVVSFMSQLQIGREGREATVVGMPQWLEYTNLDPAILEDLAVKVTSSFHIDPDDPATRQFIELYKERYGAYPDLQAFLGYDAIRYVVPLVNKYGRNWTAHLPARFDGLASDYELTPVYGGGDSERPIRYENSAVRVLTFRDFAFRE